MRSKRGLIAAGVTAAFVGGFALPIGAQPDGGTTFTQENLVSDQPGVATLTDPNLVNAWGMSRSATSPIWVSDNGTNLATLYTGDNGTAPVSIVPLVVSIPDADPTGQVNNDTSAFVVPGTTSPARFIFTGESGGLFAWNGGSAAVSVNQVDGAVYKGLALDHSPFGPLLLAANFHDNRIDVFDGSFTRLPVDMLFHDPFLPHGYAPFNVVAIGDQIYVSYAKQDAAAHDDVAGPGHGFVDVYTNYGALVRRLVSHGPLNSPWGMVIAPPSFGQFAGDLLIGNFGDGAIHAVDPTTGAIRGALRGTNGMPLVIDGLWGLIVGDAAAGGPDAVWFSAGPDGESHGLLGVLRAAPAGAARSHK